LACKWPCDADKSKFGWDKEFMSNIGLASLAADDFRKIGNVNNFQLYFDYRPISVDIGLYA